MGRKTDFVLGVLNGAVGDYLDKTGNGLATEMAFVHRGRPIAMTAEGLGRAIPAATGRVVVLLHGLMNDERFWAFGDGEDYGSMLARDLGMTPLRLRYNSGLAIPTNGQRFSALMNALVASYPVPIDEIVLVGYSMGGLVARSACHTASVEDHPWLAKVTRALYVGTPHSGAALERVGRVVAHVLDAVDDPVTRLLADLANLRSDGVKDLGDADLRHEDRARRRLTLRLRDRAHPVPLLPTIAHYLVAGALSPDPVIAGLFGDAVVPLGSATAKGDAGIVPERVRVITGLSHVALAHHPEVYAQLRAWCQEDP